MLSRLTGPDAAISPTGYVTGYAWVAAGWSDPALATRTGRVIYDTTRLPNAVAGVLGLPTLTGLLLGRHRVIDTLLADAIDDGRISQVIELACGLSPRGLTFTRRYRDLTYLEADLPGMAATKRRLLGRAGPLAPGHQVLDVDAFAADGPTSVAGLAARLAADRGVAVITEGLLNYFPTSAVTGLWDRLAGVLGTFPAGLYLADIGLRPRRRTRLIDAGLDGLQAVVGGRVQLHFAGAAAATERLLGAGFAGADVRPISGWPAAAPWRGDPATHRMHVLAATT